MDSLASWLKATWLSGAIMGHTWVWPLCESLHFVGLALVVGVAGFFDLRLMGWMKSVPLSAARELLPFAVAGFLVNFVTGVIFFVGVPDQYVHNRAWWLKVTFLILAGLNAVFFELIAGPEALQTKAGEDTSARVKIIGAVSLISWLSVLFWGRMLPFLGNAF